MRALVVNDIPTLAQSKVTNLVSDLAAKAPLSASSFTEFLEIAETTAPSNSAAGKWRVYFKSSDHKPYEGDSSGTETEVGAGTSGGGDVTTTSVAYASRPASDTTAGDLYFATDRPIQSRCPGIAWEEWAFGFKLTALPAITADPATGFAWVAQGSATAVTTYGGIQFRPMLMRIADDGTNRTFLVTMNGRLWSTAHSVGRTDYLTGNRLGAWIENIANIGVSMHLLSWRRVS